MKLVSIAGIPSAGAGAAAVSTAFPSAAVNCPGVPRMSDTLIVPIALPSLFHSSAPPTPALAVK